MNTITLGVPTVGHIHHENVSSIVGLIGSGFVSSVALVPRLPVHLARTRIVALTPTSHLLFADDDMTYTTNNLIDLRNLMDKTGARVVCGLAMTRSQDKNYPVVLKEVGKQWAITRKFDAENPSKVDGATLAFALIDMSVFNDIGAEFKFENNVGEDVDFFKRCKAKNIDVWLHPKVRVGHIMDRVVTYAEDHTA